MALYGFLRSTRNSTLYGILGFVTRFKQSQETLDECGLFDLGFVGNKFTWFKTHPDGGVVWERLDRALSTAAWFDLFPATKVTTLECASSDHNPIMVLLEGINSKPQRPWRFE